MKLTLVATCMFGLEKILGEEIDALGLTRLDTMDGRVTFEVNDWMEELGVRDQYIMWQGDQVVEL